MQKTWFITGASRGLGAKIAEAEGNVSRAAELMGMDRSHLYRRMKVLGINVREERAQTF